jgi:hypothetical protein
LEAETSKIKSPVGLISGEGFFSASKMLHPLERKDTVCAYTCHKGQMGTNLLPQALSKGPLIPSMRSLSSWLNHILKALPFDICHIGD